MTVWVLAADASRARFFEAGSRIGPLSEVKDLVHPASRLKEQGLVSDGPGRGRAPAAGGGHTMGHEDAAGREECERFARDVAQALRQAREAGHYQRLHLVAAPRFLGLLREHLDAATRALVVNEQDANLTGMDAAAIRSRLPERL